MIESGTAEASLRASLSEPDFPAVLPFSRLSQLMEHAAAKLMRPMLRDGESSVALSLDLTHAVTGPVIGNLRAVATKRETVGREHRFLVHVFDESGLVASAEHSRAIVAARRLEGLARRRVGKLSMLMSF